MLIFIWIVVFAVSLAVLVKGADLFLDSSERIGLAMGISPFVIGVTLVAAGTSFPELISSFAALWKGAPELIAANAIGSNIANILLIVGVVAVFARKIVVQKDLIDLDLPLLAISMFLTIGVAYDGLITRPESIVLFVNYILYILYIANSKDITEEIKDEVLESRPAEKKMIKRALLGWLPKISLKDFILLALGCAMLAFGANYLVESVIALSTIFNIGVAVIGISAVAIGTSLPELIVSVRAAFKGKPEIAIGNILGSNIFNIFVVIGLPGLFTAIPVDNATLFIALPTMIIATIAFVISGTSKTIYMWEGAGYLSLYLLFMAKLFNLF